MVLDVVSNLPFQLSLQGLELGRLFGVNPLMVLVSTNFCAAGSPPSRIDVHKGLAVWYDFKGINYICYTT
jgi:hypothetical protein